MPRFQAVIFDWAGTTVDYGSRAPTQAFIEIFRRRGIEITEPEARGPMGLTKRDHIAAIAALPRVARIWRLGAMRQWRHCHESPGSGVTNTEGSQTTGTFKRCTTSSCRCRRPCWPTTAK